MDTYQTPLNLANLIDKFVALRDRKRELEQRHEEELKPFTQIMDEIASQLLTHMQQMNVDHVATPGGTAYQTTKRSASIRDKQAFKQYVVETGAFDMLDWKANATAVFKFIEDNNGSAPPGINPSSRTAVNVRRPNEKE
jgi:hypothetical protein